MYRKIHYNKKLSRQNNSSFDFNDSVFFLEGGWEWQVAYNFENPPGEQFYPSGLLSQLLKFWYNLKLIQKYVLIYWAWDFVWNSQYKMKCCRFYWVLHAVMQFHHKNLSFRANPLHQIKKITCASVKKIQKMNLHRMKY